jgi:hypothetical protein
MSATSRSARTHPKSGQPRPRALATLRNLTAGLIRQSGHDGIAATIRDAEYDNDLLYALLRITPDL